MPPDLTTFEARFEEICLTELEITPAVAWVLDPGENSAARSDPITLPGVLRPLSPMASKANAQVLRLFVYGAMPDSLRRRFGFSWSNADRLEYAGLAAALRAAGPAVKRGALSGIWPEGTPHLEPGSHHRVIKAGPSIAQRRVDTSDAA
jgi:hypothetical protein